MISQAKFRHIVEQHLVPLVAGSKLTGCRRSCADFVTSERPSSMALSLTPGPNRQPALLLSRRQYFAREEVGLIANVLEKWSRIFNQKEFEESYFDVVAERGLIQAIVESVDLSCSKTLLAILEAMINWTGQTYEGKNIVFSIGIESKAEGTAPPGGIRFTDLLGQDFLKVMTSGHDTVLVCDPRGVILRHDTLFEPDSETLAVLDDSKHNLFAPLGFIPVARWAGNGRYAAALNPEGEIQVFKNGSLLFARRREKWIYFTHSAYIAGLGSRVYRKDELKAVYQTMLDVSFNRSGGVHRSVASAQGGA